MKPELRDYFDQQLDDVMSRMPPRVHTLLEEVTMYVEDYPSRKIMQEMGVRRRSQLCGLYTGVPLTQRHVDLSGVLSDAIHLYREGILAMAKDGRAPPPRGRCPPEPTFHRQGPR
jgi:predicted Zn-dependent protease with MMP-like domain